MNIYVYFQRKPIWGLKIIEKKPLIKNLIWEIIYKMKKNLNSQFIKNKYNKKLKKKFFKLFYVSY